MWLCAMNNYCSVFLCIDSQCHVWLYRTVSCWVSLKWHFCPVILIISEDILAPAPADEEGRKELYNHVQLVLLHNFIMLFHCANYLFVAIMCFAKLVNSRLHLDSQSDCLEERLTGLFYRTTETKVMFLFLSCYRRAPILLCVTEYFLFQDLV